MTSSEIRGKFLDFFEARGHTVVKSSSLIPDDPSVLLTSAGMQQFKKYFTGELDARRDFGSLNTASAQKCFRTSDIDEVGDESHLTFFEMLGNFSFGGYFKEKAIEYAFEFITKVMKLEIDYVSVFDPEKVPAGDWRKGVPFDEESYKIWQKFMPASKIRREGIDNFWGPTGSEGPCGPTTEIYVKNVEVWNIVFNEYYCRSRHPKHFDSHPERSEGSQDSSALPQNDRMLEPLKTPGVDTGMGLERLAMTSQEVSSIFETDLFSPIMKLLKGIGDGWSGRIVADHVRGIVFLISDGVRPSNKDQGYILRRVIRRVIPHLKRQTLVKFDRYNSPPPLLATLKNLAEHIIKEYGKFYTSLIDKRDEILSVIVDEEKRFLRVYDKGNDILLKLIHDAKDNKTFMLAGKDIFMLVTTHGFSLEWIKDIAKLNGVVLDINSFELEFKKHQEISRAGKEAKFGGHGIYLKTGEVTVRDKSELEKVTRLHTATHLLHAGLRAVLGDEVRQDGSDITVERTRFDFRFPRKVTPEELQKVEKWVNNAIAKNLAIEWKEMGYEEAIQQGALGFFREKYPERVKVYTARDPRTGEVFSKELCGGPHVSHTGEIGSFAITKEESVGAGVRRVRGAVKP